MSNTKSRDDKDDSLETIRKKHGGSLASTLIELQRYKQHEEGEPAWMEYVQNLPCVRIPAFRPQSPEPEPKRDRTSSLAKMLAMRYINAFEDGCYAAISYRWDKPEWEDGARGGYQCTTVGSHCPKNCPVRDEIIHRVISFCGYKKCDLFWIDQLCVDQQNESRKQTAILAMHQVYRRSKLPLAILSIHIDKDDDLKLLSLILGGHMPNERAQQDRAFTLVEKLVSDPWWKSAWTYHEDHLSSTNLTLLIPHSPELNGLKVEINRRSDGYDFGELKNELCVNSARFRKEVSTFCSEYQKSFDPETSERKACQAVLQAAPKYTQLLCSVGDDGIRRARVSMSPYIFADIAKREIKELSDRSAIASNCCDYPITVDPEAIKRGQSPSLVMLALYLLNGEILINDKNQKHVLQDNVFEFLRKQSFQWFRAPTEANSLTFFKSYRFANPEFTERGIKVNGLLWKLSKPKYVTTNRRVSESDSQYGLKCRQRRRLRQLEKELRFGGLGPCYKQLANDVHDYLDTDKQWRGDKTPSKEYKDIMANEIIAAMNEGKPLRLGCIRDPAAEDVPYRGIFICDTEADAEADAEEAYVFTSFQDGNKSWKDLPKVVSMDVEVPAQGWARYSTPFLKTKRWRNGLIFFRGEKFRPFIFPWPAAFL